jgi:plasmid replication initiation protein
LENQKNISLELQAKLTKEIRLKQLFEDLKSWNDTGKEPKPR